MQLLQYPSKKIIFQGRPSAGRPFFHKEDVMKGTRVLLGLALMVATLAGCSLDGGLSLRAEGDSSDMRWPADRQ